MDEDGGGFWKLDGIEKVLMAGKVFEVIDAVPCGVSVDPFGSMVPEKIGAEVNTSADVPSVSSIVSVVIDVSVECVGGTLELSVVLTAVVESETNVSVSIVISELSVSTTSSDVSTSELNNLVSSVVSVDDVSKVVLPSVLESKVSVEISSEVVSSEHSVHTVLTEDEISVLVAVVVVPGELSTSVVDENSEKVSDDVSEGCSEVISVEMSDSVVDSELDSV